MDPSDGQHKQGHVLAGKYEILSEIGRGGFGMVYRARQINIGREVAIKVLPPQFMAVADVVARFKREAKLTSQLTHPNTITIHDYGQADGLLFIVMEFLEGEDLADLLKREPVLPEERIVHISRQILKSLSEAHRKGIVHRDLKPENIFLCAMNDEEDFVRVLDFGIAKLAQPDGSSLPGRQLTVSGSTVGTPVYMSPEQAAGEDVDHLTDLYALGIMMYEMACGRPPFVDDNPVKIMRSHLFTEVPPFSKGSALSGSHVERVVLRALEKEKELRYRDARAFLQALEQSKPQIMALPSSLLSSLPVSARELTPPQLEDDLPTVELTDTEEEEEDAFQILPDDAKTSTGEFDTHTPQAFRPTDAVPFDVLAHLEPPTSRRAPPMPGLDGASSPYDDEDPFVSESLSSPSEGLSTTSAILSIIDHVPEMHEQRGEDVIVLTKPKNPSNSYKREDLDVGQEGQAPVSFGPIEVTDSLAQPMGALLNDRVDEEPAASAMDSVELVPERAPDPLLQEGGVPEEKKWSWDPQSTPGARGLDSGAYPQLKQKREASMEARRGPARLVLVSILLLLIGAAAVYALYALKILTI